MLAIVPCAHVIACILHRLRVREYGEVDVENGEVAGTLGNDLRNDLGDKEVDMTEVEEKLVEVNLGTERAAGTEMSLA